MREEIGNGISYFGDCLEYMNTLDDNSIDIIFTDPPYALGSEIIIRKDGKVDYKKAVDFMNKWDMPSADFWEEWYREAIRVLKHGGHCLMFGMDRQLLLFKYYASLAGFTEKQSLYWYFIQNFPKATCLSKQLDNAGAEREVVGEYDSRSKFDNCERKKIDSVESELNMMSETRGKTNITAPSTPLAKKYDGYKYSIAPLKQTNETIMVFQKPYLSGSCLHDTLAFENGDESITIGALDIDGNRVGISENDMEMLNKKASKEEHGIIFESGERSGAKGTAVKPNEAGRYPSQTFCDSGAGEVLDRQSGVKTSNNNRKNKIGTPTDSPTSFGVANKEHEYSDTGGSSKILHKCDYEKEDHDLYFYCPKVSKSERGENNNHPTLKPQKLLTNILSLFKTPNEQVLLDPFSGSFSIPLVCEKIGYKWIACEQSEEYFNIGTERVKNILLKNK